jgi:hypothetical protein
MKEYTDDEKKLYSAPNLFNTVKLELRDHLWDKEKVVFQDR